MTTTSSITAVLRRLAEAEEPCYKAPIDPGFMVVHRGDACDCHGTGRVPRFRDAQQQAAFRKLCPCSTTTGPRCKVCSSLVGFARDWQIIAGSGHPKDCKACHGLGWLPLDLSEVHLETVLEAVRSQDWEMEIAQKQVRSHVWIHRGVTNLAFQDCDAGQELEAALLALDAALGAEA